jgi:hypothetical protein
MEHTLGVWLNDIHVGQLNLTRNDGCEFRLVESYKRLSTADTWATVSRRS